ncbi:MAG: lamin tail domain-containing protein [Bacteroidota bacterium]|nr:lamin tail domain-containing protein [Bacteroidota bacterium]
MKPRIILLIICLLPAYINAQNRYEVVIDEIMADPTPQIGLPNNEWIELKNTSTAPVNLQNWRIGDASGISGPMPGFTLQPDSFVIVCASSAIAAMSVFGAVIAVTSFPSLDNNSDQLFLKAANGKTIHGVSYTLAWYQNELKKNGGWSLEMIDTQQPCAGSNNWKASTNNTGGTPGKKNSVDAVNNDLEGPQLKRAYTIDNATIILVFNEPVDSLEGATSSHYSMDGGLIITGATTLAPLFDRVQLKVNAPLQANTVYTITVTNVTDCKNNTIGSFNKTRVGLPADTAAGELIINEILFNPRSNGYDYIELCNKSTKVFDAAKLYIANRNSSGAISSASPLSTTPWLVFPGDYIVITEDADNLALNYLVKNPGWVLTLSSLPSFPDDKGYVLILDSQGSVVDEVDYRDDWHFKLLNNDEGVSLERIDPDGPSQNKTNWHSAASTAGYGTPTYKNSQYKQPPGIAATIEATPKVFSPDNDGIDDIATIQYQLTERGYVANITIFDAAGRLVRSLVRNGTLGLTGYWNWDGLDDKGNKLPVGTYIIFTEIFNLQGKKERFKNTIVLARKLN